MIPIVNRIQGICFRLATEDKALALVICAIGGLLMADSINKVIAMYRAHNRSLPPGEVVGTSWIQKADI